MRNFFGLILLATLWGCTGNVTGEQEAQAKVGEAGWEFRPVAGSAAQRVFRTNPEGKILEQGFMEDSLKTGVWIVYQEGTDLPLSMMSYYEGYPNGVALEFSMGGQIRRQATYLDGRLDGPVVEYRFGRTEKEANYKNGLLDGVYREYLPNTGKITKEIYYKNGELDGPYRFFNENEELVLEYIYKQGKQVGEPKSFGKGSANPPR